MKASTTNRLIVAILVVVGLAILFWTQALAPKREEASKLSGEVDRLQVSVAEARSSVEAAQEARREFPSDYRQLVVLGKAVPASDETSSLLVELDRIARRSKVSFNGLQLSSGSGEAAPAPAPAPENTEPAESGSGEGGAVPAAATVPPTEAAAALLPLGATIGSAGLGVMPYTLTFSGNFSHIADFIEGVDSLVHTGGNDVAVDGRLVTVNGFNLAPDEEAGFPLLDATFSVTTYLTPPSQGTTAGATPSSPEAPLAAETTESEAGAESAEVSTAK
ncbi:MAG: hypothetical protein ACOYD4_12040 [Solirubrobacterales bacterium]